MATGLLAAATWACLFVVAASAFDVPTVAFEERFSPLFGDGNLVRSSDDRSVRLLLDRRSGSGFISSDYYLHGFFSASIKLPKDYTAGVVVAFYAVEIGKELTRKHFIHHVFREIDFEDGTQNLYRFLEHDPAVPKYYNFRGSTNDGEPRPAAAVGQRMTRIMLAILEAYASDDRRHLDYSRIAASEEFRRYANLVQELQRADMTQLPAEERLPFFLNLHNAMAIHAVIRVGQPGAVDRRPFFSDFQYIVGGHPYSLSAIRNGILRANRRQPYTLVKPFGSNDRRLELAQRRANPLVHFALCDATRSSPIVRFYTTQGVEPELRHAAREFFLRGGVEIDLESRTVHLTRIIKWYSADFGLDRDILRWLLNYLDPTKAGLLTHLLNDGGPINISYMNYDWSLNV